MHFREGDRVAYVGPETDGFRVGDEGRVISASSSANHVAWDNGERQGQIDLLSADDITPLAVEGSQGLVGDSLEYGPLVTFSAREVYDDAGSVGVVQALADDGHLATLVALAENYVAKLAQQVRHDTSVGTVLSSLADDEAEAVVTLISSALLHDALGEGEDLG